MMMGARVCKILERRSCLGDRAVDGQCNIKMDFREVNYENMNGICPIGRFCNSVIIRNYITYRKRP
jgi:hypothetical protein